MRTNQYIILGLFLLLLSGCAGSRKDDPALQLRVHRVQATLSDIAAALDQYQKDNGFFPKGMATLRDAAYLSIMPDLEREWAFEYFTDGGRIMMVEATSRATMPDGAGYRITYQVPEQSWEGYGITIFPK
ncbi:MAG: hypothetical protein ABH878_06480 [bacterium]